MERLILTILGFSLIALFNTCDMPLTPASHVWIYEEEVLEYPFPPPKWYHTNPRCSGLTRGDAWPEMTTLSDAERRGYTPCRITGRSGCADERRETP